jgi:hypothetical protein
VNTSRRRSPDGRHAADDASVGRCSPTAGDSRGRPGRSRPVRESGGTSRTGASLTVSRSSTCPRAVRRAGHQRSGRRRTGRLCPLRRGHFARAGTAGRDVVPVSIGDRVQYPPARRVRGHRTEHVALVGQRRDVADALATIGEHHRQIDQHPGRVVRGLRRRSRPEHRRQPRGQRHAVCQLGQQPCPDMRHDIGTVSGHLDRRASMSSVHVQGAFLFADPQPSPSSEFLTGKALSIIYTPTKSLDREEESGLEPWGSPLTGECDGPPLRSLPSSVACL